MDSDKIPLTDLRYKSTSPWKPTSDSGIGLTETEPSTWGPDVGNDGLYVHIPGGNNSSPTIHQPLLTNVRAVRYDQNDENVYTPSLPDTVSLTEPTYNEDWDIESPNHEVSVTPPKKDEIPADPSNRNEVPVAPANGNETPAPQVSPSPPVDDEPHSKSPSPLEHYSIDQNKTEPYVPKSEQSSEPDIPNAIALYANDTETKMPSNVRFSPHVLGAAGLTKATCHEDASNFSEKETHKQRGDVNRTVDSEKDTQRTSASRESGANEKQHSSHKARNTIVPLKKPKIQRSDSYEREIQRKKNITFGQPDDNTDGAGCCGWLLYMFSILLIIVTLPFSLFFCIKVVQEYERAVIFRLGRLPSGGAKGPGIFFIIPCIESYSKIDLRTVSFDVPPQEVLTKDSVTVSVDAVVYYRVSNPTVSVANVENAHHSTRLLAQTTLRNILGTKNMSEILSDRESISQGMQSTLDEATDRWGIKVERVEIKDVRLPVQLQRAMAAEAEAAREARAKVIAAEGEQKASHALKEAADVMANSSAALQLRYLQTLSSISSEKNSTIVFPLPIDILKCFIDKK